MSPTHVVKVNLNKRSCLSFFLTVHHLQNITLISLSSIPLCFSTSSSPMHHYLSLSLTPTFIVSAMAPSLSVSRIRCCSRLHCATTRLVSPSLLHPRSSLSLSRSKVRLHFPRSKRSAAAVTVQSTSHRRCCSVQRCRSHPMPAPSPPSSPPVSVEITVASMPVPASTHAAALLHPKSRSCETPSPSSSTSNHSRHSRGDYLLPGAAR